MVEICEAIVVEGRYDKNTLSQIVSAPVFETGGFHIFNDKEQMSLLRRVAIARGLIVFTDSDGAGFLIRNKIKSAIPPQYLKHAYIPDIHGKEKRKSTPGKEGKLGVEGMTPNVILDALRKAGATFADSQSPIIKTYITKQDFFELGLSGGKDSSNVRKKLLQFLQLPEHMSSNTLLQTLSLLYSVCELREIVSKLELDDG